MESTFHCRSVPPQTLNALLSPDALTVSCAVEECATSSGLELSLLNLIKVRVSQIHGCSGCIDRHTGEARRAGEAERRLYMLSTWRSSPHFTPRERAALSWAEAVTLVVGQEVPDWIYQSAREQLTDTELAVIAVATADISGRTCR